MNTAKQLVPGDQSWDKKQRDFRTVSKIVPVPESTKRV
jgi:hypothetical protein